jgi:hypothetical protein
MALSQDCPDFPKIAQNAQHGRANFALGKQAGLLPKTKATAKGFADLAWRWQKNLLIHLQN